MYHIHNPSKETEHVFLKANITGNRKCEVLDKWFKQKFKRSWKVGEISVSWGNLLHLVRSFSHTRMPWIHT